MAALKGDISFRYLKQFFLVLFWFSKSCIMDTEPI
jgi:hypothetical protein